MFPQHSPPITASQGGPVAVCAAKSSPPSAAKADAGVDPAELYSKAHYWLLADRELKPADKVVWLALARWDWQDLKGLPRSWYPSNRDIGEATGLSDGQVDRSLRRLIARGYLERLDFEGDPRANPTHRVLVRKHPEAASRMARPPHQNRRGGGLKTGAPPAPFLGTTLRSLSLEEKNPPRSPDGGRDLDLSNDNDPDASGPLRLIPAPEPEAAAETVDPAPKPDPEPPPAADPPPQVDPSHHDRHIPAGPPGRPAPSPADEQPAAVLMPRAMTENLAAAMAAAPESSAERGRHGDLKRAGQMEALRQRLAGPPPPIETPPRPPAPPPAPTEPEADPPPPLPLKAEHPRAQAYLDGLDDDQVRQFRLLSPAKQRRQLEHAGRVGTAGLGILSAELAVARSTAPAPRPHETMSTYDMIISLPIGGPGLVVAVARAIAIDFEDAKSWPAFEGDARAVWERRYPAEQLAEAYRQGMNPGTENPGAVYNHHLKRCGWKSRRGSTARLRKRASA